MPATPTVSMCAFSISDLPPPEPRATATTFARFGSKLGERGLETGTLAPLGDEARELELSGAARRRRQD